MAAIHDVPGYSQASPFRPGVTLLVLSLIMVSGDLMERLNTI